MAINEVRKRDGSIVPFDRLKIEVAIGKAFQAKSTAHAPTLLAEITDSVIEELDRDFSEGDIPHVENIQDIVERKIAEKGYFAVAKAYILYRAQQTEDRRKKAKEAGLRVIKRGGEYATFDIAEIEKTIEMLHEKQNGDLDRSEIFGEIKSAIFDGIATKEINQIILMALRGRIERDLKYSKLAARFLFNDLYKDILSTDETSTDFKKRYQTGFAEQIKKGIKGERIDKRLAKVFDLKKLAAAIEPERDRLFHYLGAQVIYDRYLIRDLDNTIIELPQYFWMRVAMGVALDEEKDNTKHAINFYNLISQLYYVPSTPTLLNAGTVHPQMSSCYISTVQDELTDIFKTFGDNAQLSKWSGGVGNDWSNIRGTGALIKRINVPSQGVIPFLKIVDSTTASINRSGKRRGATCVYLETWHWDIESFLELRKNTGDDRRRTHDINTSNWIPDLFMKRVLDGQMWTLFSPEEAPDLHHLYGKAFEKRYAEYEQMADEGKITLFKRMPAKDLWRKMITMLFETGHPWITFKDPCNIRSPQDHVGVVHSSNLCTEITLNTSLEEVAVCNLGSINLARHVKGGKLDEELLADTSQRAMRMLDNIIDTNFYPIPEAKTSNSRHRPVGLGVMGFQDALYMLKTDFDSEKAVQLTDQIQEIVAYNAILASSKLAKERGKYKSYKGSKWDRGIFPLDTLDLLEKERGIETGVDKKARLDWKKVKAHVKKYGMRNSNCMAIAPTATISNISGCFPSIEPIYKNLYVKSNFSGEFTVINHYLAEDLKKLNLWNGEMLGKIKYYNGSIQNIKEIPENIRSRYKEAFEIEPVWVIKEAAHRAKWIDQSQSINLFTSTTSGQAISDMYMTAWKMGLKTTYYLRTLAASSVEKSTIDINKTYQEEPKAEVVETTVSVVEIVSEPAPVEVPVPEPQPVQVPEFTGMDIDPKLCRIDDPDCEACQ
jgi:ribonucleoside-diphosphate reductase alpha chain